MQEINKTNSLTKPAVKKPSVYYYLLTFIYLSVAIVLGMLGLRIERLGEESFSAKVLALFFIFLALCIVFLTYFIIYFLIAFVFCAFAFIYINKDAYLLESTFDFYTSQRWNDAINAGKTWFRYGTLAAIIALSVAVMQVQIFQGGRGGLNEQYNTCVEWSQDGKNTCLLQVTLTRPIGQRLSRIMILYSGQAFLWGGLFFVVIKHGKNLNKSINYLIQKRKQRIKED